MTLVRHILVMALLCGGMVFTAGAAHLVDQVVELHPGWNAIFLEVEPATNTPSEVFADVPILSAWTWVRRNDKVEFFQNLSETLLNDPHWLVFFPTNRYEAMFNDLYRIKGNRAYFIKLDGSNDFTWTVSGRSAVLKYEWSPNEFNMVGFPMDPAAAQPTVSAFFGRDDSLAGQAVYRLNAAGAWELVGDPAAQNMAAGESMWVYAAGESSYLGPLGVSVEQGDGLDYGASVTELRVNFANRSAAAEDVSVRDLSGAGGPLSYWTFNTNTLAVEWLPLPDPLAFTVEASGAYSLRIAIDREAMAGATYETTLEVIGDQGTRVRIPVTASK